MKAVGWRRLKGMVGDKSPYRSLTSGQSSGLERFGAFLIFRPSLARLQSP
jgi:hypothetical protein